jgi:hypothetical protein
MHLPAAVRVDLEEHRNGLIDQEKLPIKTSMTGWHLYSKGSLEPVCPCCTKNTNELRNATNLMPLRDNKLVYFVQCVYHRQFLLAFTIPI